MQRCLAVGDERRRAGSHNNKRLDQVWDGVAVANQRDDGRKP